MVPDMWRSNEGRNRDSPFRDSLYRLKITRGKKLLHRLTDIPRRAALKGSLVNNSSVSVIEPIEAPGFTYSITVGLLRILMEEQVSKRRFPLFLVYTFPSIQQITFEKKYSLLTRTRSMRK